MSGKMILNYEFDRAITSLKAGREGQKIIFISKIILFGI